MVTLKNLAEAAVYADEIDIYVYENSSIDYEDCDDMLGYWKTSLLEVLNDGKETAFKNYLNYIVTDMSTDHYSGGTQLFIEVAAPHQMRSDAYMN